MITGMSVDLRKKIDRRLRYRPAGYQYDPAFKYKKWDGWVRLFVDDCQFPAGLVPRVKDLLDAEGVSYVVDDISSRPREGSSCAFSIVGGVEDRYYQREAAEAAVAAERGVVRAPTGAGKTVIAARIIEQVGVNTVVLVPTVDLLFQTKSFLEWALDSEIGMLGAGVVDPKPVTVATTKTMAKVLHTEYVKYTFDEYAEDEDFDIDEDMSTWLRSIGCLLVDECHTVAADTAFNIATNMECRYKIGLSASPWRDDGADLKIEAALGPIVYRIGVDTLVDEGFLVPPVFRIYDTRPDDAVGEQYDTYAKAYKACITDNAYRNDMISSLTNDLIDQGRTVLVLVRHLKHGEKLRKMIPGSVFIAGSSPKDVKAFHESGDRERILDDIRNRRIQCLISSTVADMGLDVPALDAVVLAGGGKSSTRHLQRIGRICRPFEGKDHGIVIDFDDGWAHVRGNGQAGWFSRHTDARRKIEHEEWGGSAIWI